MYPVRPADLFALLKHELQTCIDEELPEFLDGEEAEEALIRAEADVVLYDQLLVFPVFARPFDRHVQVPAGIEFRDESTQDTAHIFLPDMEE